ncbi:IS3 family transposase [Enterococcus rotai]|uniref:IS3 family transposase n=1 Tax=Enterococcus rotai TaxID=118060 RepID=UPI0032B61808
MSKKVQFFNSGENEEEVKVLTILELKKTYPVTKLLKLAKLRRSTYYYWVKKLSKLDKYAELKKAIKKIYISSKKRYGYRRVTDQLKKEGWNVNHKTVLKVMSLLGLKSVIRRKKYSSYREKNSGPEPNILDRKFKAEQPYEKLVTNITEFKVLGEKLYLSPVMDLFNGEILCYEIDSRLHYHLVESMLNKLVHKLDLEKNQPLLHSDQGWHYRIPRYKRTLKKFNIIQSMSRKGNCYDNACIENFFGHLKSEFYYQLENIKSKERFIEELDEYINWYNEKRIKRNLNRMSPIEYRLHCIQVS